MTESKNADPSGCPATTIGGCEPVCARCGRDMTPTEAQAAAPCICPAGFAFLCRASVHAEEVGALARAVPTDLPPNRSEWTSPDTWRDPDCIECGGEGAPCCDPPDHPYVAPVDWPARFRAAAGVAAHLGHGSTASSLVDVAEDFDDYLQEPVREAIGRALLGEETS